MEEKSCATPPVVGPPSIEKFFSSPLTQSILIYPRGRQWGRDGNSPRVNTIARTGSQAPRLASKAADARPRIGPRSSNVCPLVNQARAPRNITRRPERLINQALEPAINQHRGKSPPPHIINAPPALQRVREPRPFFSSPTTRLFGSRIKETCIPAWLTSDWPTCKRIHDLPFSLSLNTSRFRRLAQLPLQLAA
jgi:hypothetical protein